MFINDDPLLKGSIRNVKNAKDYERIDEKEDIQKQLLQLQTLTNLFVLCSNQIAATELFRQQLMSRYMLETIE
jgi:hypothetical protein